MITLTNFRKVVQRFVRCSCYSVVVLYSPFLFSQEVEIEVDSIYKLAVKNADTRPKETERLLNQLIEKVEKEYSTMEVPKAIQSTYFDSYHFLSYFQRRNGEFEKSIASAYSSINLKKQYQKDSLLTISYIQMAKSWQAALVMDESLKNLTIADSLATAFTQTKELITIYSSLGSAYEGLQDTINATTYYTKSLRLVDSVGTSYQKAAEYANYSHFLQILGRYTESLTYLKKATALHRSNNNNIGLESALFAQGTLYNRAGNPNKAIPLLIESIELSKKISSKSTIPFRYKALSQSYKSTGDYKAALHYYRLYKEAMDARNTVEQVKKMTELQKDLTYKKQKEIDSLAFAKQKELDIILLSRKANTRFYIALIVFIILLAIFGFLYFRNKQKIKDQAFRNIILNNKVATKTEEINELLTETIQHIKSKERIAENLQKLSNENEGITLKSIIADLKSSKADNAKLMLIKQNIEQVNFEFIKKLTELHPELTKTDIEICSLIRIGLSRKEVANLRNTSLEAVKTSRFRLKKKLSLSADDALDDYVNIL